MKRSLVLFLLLLVLDCLAADTSLVLSQVGSFSLPTSRFHVELDSLLKVYSYNESPTAMQIHRRTYSPGATEPVIQLLWEAPLPQDMSGPLRWHRGERAYGRIWLYLGHDFWLGAISVDEETGVADFYQTLTPGFTYIPYEDNGMHHFGEGHIFFAYGYDVYRWDLNDGEPYTILQYAGNTQTSLQRLGNEYLIITKYPLYNDFPCYLIDSNLNLITSNLSGYFFTAPYKFQDGLYWVKFHKRDYVDSYGSGTLLISDGNITVGVWDEFDPMNDFYHEYRPIIRMPNSLYLCDAMWVNTSNEIPHHYRVKRHNGGNSFTLINGFPQLNTEAQYLGAVYFQNLLLMIGWDWSWQDIGVSFQAADLSSQTWVPVSYPEELITNSCIPKVLSNDEQLWFIYQYYDGATNIIVCQGTICVENDDPGVPPVASLSIWPNPARACEKLTLKSQSTIISVTLYNIRGQMLKELLRDSQNADEYILPNLPLGLYLLKTTDADHKLLYSKIVIGG